MMNPAATLSLLVLVLVRYSHGFSLPYTHIGGQRYPTNRFLSQDDSNDVMKTEIEEMRKEARRRIEALNTQITHGNSSTTSTSVDVLDQVEKTVAFEPVVAVSNKPVASETERPSYNSKSIARVKKQEVANLLDDTRWKITLNIGREPGTWMPKTWGVSGERLLLNLEVDFSPDQLYEREEFLNGMAGAKVLDVVNGELTMGPSITEGARKVPVKNGGWRIAKGEGPMGTDLLRFYIDLEEEVRHRGRDVHCPKGRVYCTCGFFPLNIRHQTGTLKQSLREQQEMLSRRYEQLLRENEEDKSLISWTKLKRTKELVDLRIEGDRLRDRMNEARVREPDKSLLRLSRDQDVGLTREGGICCKVVKGLATEYHILGKFQVASIDIRDEDETSDSLRPKV